MTKVMVLRKNGQKRPDFPIPGFFQKTKSCLIGTRIAVIDRLYLGEQTLCLCRLPNVRASCRKKMKSHLHTNPDPGLRLHLIDAVIFLLKAAHHHSSTLTVGSAWQRWSPSPSVLSKNTYINLTTPRPIFFNFFYFILAMIHAVKQQYTHAVQPYDVLRMRPILIHLTHHRWRSPNNHRGLAPQQPTYEQNKNLFMVTGNNCWSNGHSLLFEWVCIATISSL